MNSIKNPPLEDKSVQRKLYIEKRKILIKNKEHKSALDDEIQSRLILSAEYRSSDSVLLYAARESEIATAKIFYAAIANCKRVAYPRCGDDGTMRFFIVNSPSELKKGRFGIFEPVEDCPELIPDEHTLCVCPCLCCDMDGYRLGFGGGWYDRFLGGFCGKKAALCYTEALIPALTHEDHDIPVDMIVTDSFVKRL